MGTEHVEPWNVEVSVGKQQQLNRTLGGWEREFVCSEVLYVPEVGIRTGKMLHFMEDSSYISALLISFFSLVVIFLVILAFISLVYNTVLLILTWLLHRN